MFCGGKVFHGFNCKSLSVSTPSVFYEYMCESVYTFLLYGTCILSLNDFVETLPCRVGKIVYSL